MKTTNKTLGVIGGLGPIPTAHFLELVFHMTDASCDQEHLDMIVYNTPSTPDRTAHILDSSAPDPLPKMLSAGQALSRQGVTCILIPCMTAHYFVPRLEPELSVPLIHGIKETVRHLKENGIQKVGIMATDGSIRTGLFQQELNRQGLAAIVPEKDAQEKVMHLIYKNIKAGKPAQMDKFFSAAEALKAQGAEAIILGCTELSLLKRDYEIGAGFIDAMEVLARQAILTCGKPLKPEFDCLITK